MFNYFPNTGYNTVPNQNRWKSRLWSSNGLKSLPKCDSVGCCSFEFLSAAFISTRGCKFVWHCTVITLNVTCSAIINGHNLYIYVGMSVPPSIIFLWIKHFIRLRNVISNGTLDSEVPASVKWSLSWWSFSSGRPALEFLDKSAHPYVYCTSKDCNVLYYQWA